MTNEKKKILEELNKLSIYFYDCAKDYALMFLKNGSKENKSEAKENLAKSEAVRLAIKIVSTHMKD